MIEWLLKKILPYRDINKMLGREEVLYLRRFTLWKGSRVRIFLHKIALSDLDDHPHDHPWDFRTVILRGGYEEAIFNKKTYAAGMGYRNSFHYRTLTPFMTVENKATHTHKVRLLDHHVPTWTLVIAKWDQKRRWGFFTEDGWVYWRKYLNYWGPAGDDDEKEAA